MITSDSASKLWLHWLQIISHEYRGVVPMCLATVEAIEQNKVDQQTGLQLLTRELRSLNRSGGRLFTRAGARPEGRTIRSGPNVSVASRHQHVAGL